MYTQYTSSSSISFCIVSRSLDPNSSTSDTNFCSQSLNNSRIASSLPGSNRGFRIWE